MLDCLGFVLFSDFSLIFSNASLTGVSVAIRLLPFLLPFPVDFLSIALGYPLKTVGLLNLCGAMLLSGVLLLGSDALVIGSDALVIGSDVLVIGSDVLVLDWGITFPAGAT